MKKIISILFLLLVLNNVKANNLVMSTPTYNDATKTISFTIAWNNSWKISTGPSNYDGVWVFIKRQACSSTNIWATALISTTSGDHTTSVTSGSSLLSVDAVSDGMGVFIRRTASGTGSISTHTINLKLNSSLTTQPAITASVADNFKVYGVEMVYVPQGGFYLGDGRPTNTSNFSSGDNASTALFIDAAKQTAGLGAATVYTSNPVYGCPNNLPSTFPLGYNGYWCMKYEIGMVAYVDFLNSLSYDQQAIRLTKWGTRYPNIVGTYFTNMGNKGDLHIVTAGTYNTIPAVFGTSSLTNYSPVNYLSWNDLTAYLDWTGLRPMTEFEYEKSCRGTQNPVALEYPWGNTLITSASGTNLYGQIDEKPGQLGEGLCLYNWDDYNWSPYRSGYAATSTSTRSQSGATYYGIMDMGGNLFEQVVGGGSGYDYSGFTTANGDGVLGADGNANTVGWPTYSGSNSGNFTKGGSFGTGATVVQVSDRSYYGGNGYNSGQDAHSGGRGVRSF